MWSTLMREIAFGAIGEIEPFPEKADQDWKKIWSIIKLFQRVSKGLYILLYIIINIFRYRQISNISAP